MSYFGDYWCPCFEFLVTSLLPYSHYGGKCDVHSLSSTSGGIRRHDDGPTLPPTSILPKPWLQIKTQPHALERRRRRLCTCPILGPLLPVYNF